MKSIFSKYLSYAKLVMAFRVVVYFTIFFFNSFLIAQFDKTLPSKEIVYKEALKPGTYNLIIPFDSLDGSLRFKGVVNDSGSFTLHEIIPQQTLNYNSEKDNIVQFFTGNNENPLRFIIKEIRTISPVSIELLAQDTMSLIRKVTFTDGQPINATHNNIDPKDALPNEELAKWKTNIIVDSSDIINGNLKCKVTFNRIEPFADTLFLPFEQVFVNWQSVEDAYITLKIKPERTINYARYNNLQTNDFLIKNITTGPHFEIKFIVNDIYNPYYDQMLWTIADTKIEKVYPLNMLYEISNAINVYYEYDKSRTQMPGNNKKVPDSTFFRAEVGLNSAIRLNNKQGDTLQIRTFATPSGEYLIRNSTGFVNKLEFLTFETYNKDESFKIKDKFYRYRYFLNGTKKERVLIDSTPVYKNYHGFDFYINSSDSITIFQSDAINMAKLNFWSTNSYKTAEPWQYVDTIAPKITSTNPMDKDSNVRVNTDIRLKFNEEINQDLINSNNIILRINSPLDTITPVIGSYHYEDSTAIFTPDTNLFFDTEYIVKIKNITDLADNKLKDYSFTFKTERDTTVNVSENYLQNYSMKIMPNPVDDKLMILLECELPSGISLIIYDLYGKVKVKFNEAKFQNKNSIITINVENLPPGLYLIREELTGMTRKFIKN